MGRAPTARRAFASGLAAAWRRPRLVVALYLVNLAWTLAVTWPVLLQLSSATARRPFAAPLARGLQFDLLAEIVARRPALGTATVAALGVGLMGWLALSWFLTAGVLGGVRAAPEELTLRRFAALAVGRGFALGRLQLWSAAPYALALGVLGGGALGAGYATRYATNPWWTFAAVAGGALPGLAGWLLTAATVDAGRALAVLEGEAAMWRVLVRAFGLVLRRPAATLGLQLLAGLAWLLVTAVYLAVAWPFAFAAPAAFALLTLLRQALVVARTGVRVAALDAWLTVVGTPPPA